MTRGTQRSTRIAVTALVAAVAALAAAPGFSEDVPLGKISSLAIDRTAQLATGGQKTVVTGRIACTYGSRFHVYVWVIERIRGALDKGPPHSAATPGAGSTTSSAVAYCSNTVQHWSVTAVGSGSHPAGLVKGPAEACVTATLSKHYLYVDLQQTCARIVVA